MFQSSSSLVVVIIALELAEVTALSLLAVTVDLLLALALLGSGGSLGLRSCLACRRNFSLLGAMS